MSTTTLSKLPEWRSALDAALIMAIGMGFGRFAFTAVYPHMLDEGLITFSQGGWAASANYAGYLLGAILGMRAQASNAHRLCLFSLLGTAICLGILAALHSAAALILVRGIAGVLSALSMVAATLWLLEHKRISHGAPLMFAGVGAGIAFSAELLVFGTWAGLHSDGLWLLLGGASLLIGLGAASGLMNTGTGTGTGTDIRNRDSNSGGELLEMVHHRPLIALYGLAGFGYIVTATYLPVLVQDALRNLDPAHVWAAFGLGAAPSCFLWHHLHHKIGTRKALFANLSIQAFGVILPIAFQNAAGYILSALLVGGTFMGTVVIAMPAAQRIARARKTQLVATMTVFYGVGQVIGPLVASALYAHSHSFSTSLAAAAATLAAGGLISLFAL
jgi:MFS family permease